MQLRKRLERLGKKLAPRRAVVVEWVNPKTGRWWMRITLVPTRNGRRFRVVTQLAH